jgi:hypothetical protein
MKNGNTRVDTLRETYGEGFAPGIRGDAHLNTLLERTGPELIVGLLEEREGLIEG